MPRIDAFHCDAIIYAAGECNTGAAMALPMMRDFRRHAAGELPTTASDDCCYAARQRFRDADAYCPPLMLLFADYLFRAMPLLWLTPLMLTLRADAAAAVTLSRHMLSLAHRAMRAMLP